MLPIVAFFSLSALVLFPSRGLSQEFFACVAKGGSIRIVASPSDCQANKETSVSWNVVGPTGSMEDPGEPEGAPGRSLRVVDGMGNDLGAFGGANYSSPIIRVYSDTLGAGLLINTLTGQPEAVERAFGGPLLRFRMPSCEGPAYLSPFSAGFIIPNVRSTTGFLLASTIEVEAPFQMKSYVAGNGNCYAEEMVLPGGVHVTEVQAPIQFPVALPIHLERR